MDTADSIDIDDAVRDAADIDTEPQATSAPRRRRRLHAKAGPQSLSVTSHLRMDEPVLDDEIRLILAVLGDTIVQVLNAKAACPTSSPPSDV
jgi:hypothetical protein